MSWITCPAGSVLLVLLVGLFCQEPGAAACCRRYSRRELPFTLIQGYSIQTIKRNCNIDAVIFHTSIGKHVCADPSEPWVMDSIWRLKEKVKVLRNKQKKQQSKN